MVKRTRHKITLDQPARYEIKVPGRVDVSWALRNEWQTIFDEGDDQSSPVTTLTGTVDQAGLQGALRRLYAHGLPLISVLRVENS